MAMEGCVYFAKLPAAFNNVIDKATYNEYRLGMDTAGTRKASIQVTNGSMSNYIDNCPLGAASPALALHQWHHLAYTFDGVAGLVTMLVDGVQVCQSAQTNNGNPLTAYNTVNVTSSALVLGRDTGGTGYFNGRLDEVAVYGTALTAGRLLSHYESSALGGAALVPGVQFNRLGEKTGSVRIKGTTTNYLLTLPTVPGAPTGVSATAGGSGQATVSWTPPASNGGAPIYAYTATSSPGGFVASAGGGASSVTFNVLATRTTYTFALTATNIPRTGPASSTPVGITAAMAPAIAPAAPTITTSQLTTSPALSTPDIITPACIASPS